MKRTYNQILSDLQAESLRLDFIIERYCAAAGIEEFSREELDDKMAKRAAHVASSR